ncbi:MAG: RDD family protein [Clostridia bacterium]|nr:RDD family protein [Clostridia bacterium]
MRKIIDILTPENVYVEYELAGLGSRFIAFFIDTLIQLGVIALVAVGIIAGRIDLESFEYFNLWLVAVGILLIFFVFFGYHILFELLLNGQTPGKKAARLRVIKQNGEPVGFWESLLRNILRIADFLPSLNLLGAAFILFSKNYKRIGDFAANTVVVKIRRNEQPVSLENLLKKASAGEDLERSVNIYPVTNYEYGILKEFLSRKETLGAREPVFAYHLNKYFMEKFALPEPIYTTPAEFFEDIVRMNALK